MQKTEIEQKTSEITRQIPDILRWNSEELEKLKAEIKFRFLYQHNLIFYLNPQEYSWITGIPLGGVYQKMRDSDHPYSKLFRRPLGHKEKRIHISYVSFIMSGRGRGGDAP
jgi:hypothetical protein